MPLLLNDYEPDPTQPDPAEYAGCPPPPPFGGPDLATLPPGPLDVSECPCAANQSCHTHCACPCHRRAPMPLSPPLAWGA